MFLHQNPGGERLGRILRQDRHARLPEDRPAVQLGRDLVDRAARLRVSGVKLARKGITDSHSSASQAASRPSGTSIR